MLLKNFKSCFTHLAEFSTTTAAMMSKVKNTNKLVLSEDEENRILHVLNEDSGDMLSKLGIPQSQVKKLELWKRKKGTFNNIEDVIDTEGMDVKNIAKICKSIVVDEPIQMSKKSNPSKHRQIISPILPPDIKSTLTSAVGLHLGPTSISWAKLSCPERILDVWGFRNFPDHPPKASSNENFQLAMSVLDHIPVADLYVFEALPGLNMQLQGQVAPVMTFIQQIEFNSMLLTLLNTSNKHNRFKNDDLKIVDNTVYYMKTKLPARLFQTWVGNEKVAAITTVKQLFNNSSDLPCSSLQINRTMRDNFESQSSIDKELMSQSLLLTMAFLDLCVYKNPASLQAISPFKRKR